MKTGIFGMPMADYLAEYGVSQSQLKYLARSPAHLRQYVDHPEPPTHHQKLGTITHTSVFEPELLGASYWCKPANYENAKGESKKWNGNATECKLWLTAHKDRPIISTDEEKAIFGMRDSVFAHPAAALALASGKPEQSLFCEDAETGLQLKCRCDFLSGNSVVDLKKCQDASQNGFARTVANYGYDLQAAVNLHICNALGLKKEHFIFIAVEDQPPYAVGVYELTDKSLTSGHGKFRRLLGKYLECVVADKWPAFSRNIEFLELPAYALSAEFNAQQLDDRPALPALEV